MGNKILPKEAKDWYDHSDLVHGFDHVMRVYNNAKILVDAEGGDPEIILTATLLHDAKNALSEKEGKREEHHLVSSEIGNKILRDAKWEESRIQQVLHCIRAHRYRSTEEPKTLEARIVFDADKLDSIGAIGIARAIAYSVEHNRPIYSEVSKKFRNSGKLEINEQHSSYHEYIYKLSGIIDKLFTNEAKKIGARRQDVMKQYYDELHTEMQA